MKGLLLTLAFPPTGFVTVILLGLLLQRRRRRSLGTAIAWLGLVGLILFSLPIGSQSMLLALETNLPTTPPADHKPAAIVVLGAEVIRSDNEALGVRPGPLTLDRLRTAAELARRTGLPLLATGGVTQPGTAAVGTVMGASLQDDFRTPARWIEDKSDDTWENARFSATILHAAGIDSIYVVTSAWHMRRALLAFQGTGLTVTAAPTPLDHPLAPELNDFLPHATAWLTGYYALHEWIGYAWYAMR